MPETPDATDDSTRGIDTLADGATETVEPSEIPLDCSHPQCDDDPEWAWRDRDGDLLRNVRAGYVEPCLCTEHKEAIDAEDPFTDGGEFVRVRAVAADGGGRP